MRKSQEDLANDYLKDLIDRNLVNVGNRSFSNGERIKGCYIHDLLHYFCMSKGEKEGFLQLLNTSQLCSNSIEYKQCRLCIHSEWNSFINLQPAVQNVRSLLFHPYSSSSEYLNAPDIFSRFKLLRVLDLEVLRMGFFFPEELTLLVHLRYLAVSGDFTSVPASTENLSYLETLILRSYDSIITLPKIICKMHKLKCVDIPSGVTVSSWDDHDHEKSTSLPNVVTFSLLYVSDRENAEMLLRKLPNILRLKFQFYNHFPSLHFLDKLESLNMQKFGRAMSRCSYSSIFPTSVKELTLSNLGLPWHEMSTIANLPNLVAFKLLSRSFEGVNWDMANDKFLGLKFLKLEDLDIIKWNVMENSLPCLEWLVVKKCGNLEEIPDSFVQLPTLKHIEVSECSSSVAESARKIVERVTITTKVAEKHSSASRNRSLMMIDHATEFLKKLKVQAEKDPKLDDKETLSHESID